MNLNGKLKWEKRVEKYNKQIDGKCLNSAGCTQRNSLTKLDTTINNAQQDKLRSNLTKHTNPELVAWNRKSKQMKTNSLNQCLPNWWVTIQQPGETLSWPLKGQAQWHDPQDHTISMDGMGCFTVTVPKTVPDSKGCGEPHGHFSSSNHYFTHIVPIAIYVYCPRILVPALTGK